ncbi:class I SAM-dependent methyltransferase [Halohasta salina]|uniref:class I SAM-dependent methyltransferase n=1 Tax=Halohasta salina TaxID=2961621 RepID=UPI0020A3F63B|nr:methyltransferase domain-containing protein [Halohasta salina]
MHGLGDVRFFDRLAPLYDLVMPAADQAALTAGLARAERSVDHLLDLGGGSGRATIAVEAPERTVVDVSRPMLRRARSRQPDETGRRLGRPADGGPVGPLGAVQGDARELPLADDAVDAAIVVDAFHHMLDHATVVAEVARVVRPGGVFVVREFDPSHPLGWGLVRAEHAIGMGSTFRTPDELAGLLADAGFDVALLDGGFQYTVVGSVPSVDE